MSNPSPTAPSSSTHVSPAPERSAAATEWVVLVDDMDRERGQMEKMEAHRAGELHRAFSVFVVNGAGELLLQQRAWEKYHSGGLWTNTCCSHPRPGEPVEAAAVRRLREEMGLACALKPAFQFVYRSALDHGLVEHEFDHVFIGRTDGVPVVNRAEVADFRYAGWEVVAQELEEAPERFTAWFRICFAEARSRVESGEMGAAWSGG